MLQPAINLGLSEAEFWEMTKAEVERYLEGAVWRLRNKAQFDYCLADLIGVSVARIMDNKVTFPSFEKVYPFLFEEEDKEIGEAIQTNKSVNNFLAFAQRINAKMDEGVEIKENDN